MNTIRHTLRLAARKLTLTRSVCVLLWTAAAGGAAWGLIVLFAGPSAAAFLILSALAAASLLVGCSFVRVSPLEAARHVERLAGWREKLSTALELEQSGGDNVFYERLSAEVMTLTEGQAPGGFVRWRLQRPGILAVVCLIAAGAMTALLPEGLAGIVESRRAESRRAEAEGILAGTTERLKALSLESPGVNALRLELASLLNDVRRSVDKTGIDRKSTRILDTLDADARGEVSGEARKIARELANARVLKPLADPVAQVKPAEINRAADEVAAELHALSPPDRAAAERALRRAAGDVSAACSDPLRRAADAARARDANALSEAFAALADELNRALRQAETEDRAAADARDAIRRARAVLAGTGDPGRERRVGKAEFFDEQADADDEPGRGNIVVRGKIADITEIWKKTKAVDAAVPDLEKIREDAATSTGVTLDARQREYVRRYFAPDDDNE